MNRLTRGFVSAAILTLLVTLPGSGVFGKTAPSTAGIKGINNPHIWYDSLAYSALETIKNNGFNAVRIVWSTSGSGSRLAEIIARCKALGLRPIPELHDVTGGNSINELDRMIDYWIDIKSYLPSDVWINIANEWGPADSTVWRDAYLRGIKDLRNAGISNPLVIDSGGWGQDSKDILNYGPAILKADSNIVFSIHMYGSWNDNQAIDSFLSSCQTKGLPILVGEFGYNYKNGANNLRCKVDAAHLINVCNSKGIGYLAWSWGGNNSDNAWLDLTNSGNWRNLTSWGNVFKNAAFSSPPATPATAKTATPSPAQTVLPTPAQGSSAFAVRYITNESNRTATVNITIRNNGPALKGWKLVWNFGGNQKIITLWNATYSQSGNSVTVTNAGWNATIPANGTVSFGFSMSYSGANPKPAEFTLNGKACQTF